MVATPPHPHIVANIKLRLALTTADSCHQQLTDFLLQGNLDPEVRVLLVNQYGSIRAYTHTLADRLRQEGGILPADAPALFEPDTVRAAAADLQREMMPYMEAAASQETRPSVQPGTAAGPAWTEQIRAGGSAPSRHHSV